MKKLFLAALAAVALAACQGPTPSTCTVEEQEGGSLVSCPDGTSAFIPNGQNGQNGQSVTVTSATEAQCPNGGVVITSGQTSFPVCNGAPGAPGTPGQNGTSVVVTIEQPGEHCPTGGVKLTAGTSVAYVCNGAAGPQGPPGPAGQDGKTPTIEVNPAECGGLGGIVIVLGDVRQPICNGAPGEPGPAGEPGEPGHTPVITTRPSEACEFGGIDILADDVVIGTVCNGSPGQDGHCDEDECDCTVECKNGYAKYENACYKVCQNEPGPHETVCPIDWLSKSQSCSKPQEEFLVCWPIP